MRHTEEQLELIEAFLESYGQNDAPQTVAFCRISMMGFLRLATQSRVLSAPLSIAEAWDIYRRYRSSEGIVFRPEVETSEHAFEFLTRSSNFPHRLWTDAYLAAFAIASGCRVVSFDADFGRFDDLSFLHLVA